MEVISECCESQDIQFTLGIREGFLEEAMPEQCGFLGLEGGGKSTLLASFGIICHFGR